MTSIGSPSGRPLCMGHIRTRPRSCGSSTISRSKNFGGSYKNIYNSSWQTRHGQRRHTRRYSAAAASRGAPGHASDPNPNRLVQGAHLAVVEERCRQRVGKTNAEYDHYQGKWNGNTDNSAAATTTASRTGSGPADRSRMTWLTGPAGKRPGLSFSMRESRRRATGHAMRRPPEHRADDHPFDRCAR